jgi:hypothetical protein
MPDESEVVLKLAGRNLQEMPRMLLVPPKLPKLLVWPRTFAECRHPVQRSFWMLHPWQATQPLPLFRSGFQAMCRLPQRTWSPHLRHTSRIFHPYLTLQLIRMPTHSHLTTHVSDASTDQNAGTLAPHNSRAPSVSGASAEDPNSVRGPHSFHASEDPTDAAPISKYPDVVASPIAEGLDSH